MLMAFSAWAREAYPPLQRTVTHETSVMPCGETLLLSDFEWVDGPLR